MLSAQRSWKGFGGALCLTLLVLGASVLLAFADCVGREYQSPNHASLNNPTVCYICLFTRGPLFRGARFAAGHAEGVFIGISAIATIFIAIFTYTLRTATVDLGERQSKEMKILERAHLIVEGDGISPFSAPWSVAHYTIQNVGRMPARDVQWVIEAKMSYNPTRDSFRIDWNRRSGKWVVAPGVDMKRRYEFELTARDVADFCTDDSYILYVWGKVQYTDGFGKIRWTKFCHRYGLGVNVRTELKQSKITRARMAYHQHGNDTDDT
jgi:hypothetical protein